MSGTVVVLAAGRAQRFGGDKQRLPVGPNGELLFEYAVFDAIRAGLRRVVIVTRPDLADSLHRHARRAFPADIDVAIAIQGPAPGRSGVEPWGTGAAVLAAADMVDEPFLVINADDYYGPDAFARVRAAVDARSAPPTFAMAGYPVAATLSDTDRVSRAVCESSDDGLLVHLTELRDVRRETGGRIVGRAGGRQRVLPDETTVSMNLWAFTPAVFPLLANALARFRAAENASRTAEFLLSTALDAMIQRGEIRVRVVPVPGPVFGVTHPADWDRVRAALQRLHARGQYPPVLWPGAASSTRKA